MKSFLQLCLITLCVCLMATPLWSQQTLVGVSVNAGGANNLGIVYQIKTDGTGYAKLLDVPGGSYFPQGLIQGPDGYLYGASYQSSTVGVNGSISGYVFKMKTDGSSYSIIKAFDQTTNGYFPYCKLLYYNNKLFGTTSSGKNSSTKGVLFSMNLDGSSYTELYSFSSASFPYGSLVPGPGGYLFGVSYTPNALYKIMPDGSNFSIIHSFGSVTNDGNEPNEDLLYASDGYFYGTTKYGGSNNLGTVYRVDPNGNYSIINHFTSAASGSGPFAGLFAASDGNLYGSTYSGGANSTGIIFKVSGGVYSKVTDFPSGFGTQFNTFTEYGGLLWASGATGASIQDGKGSFFSFNPANSTITKVADLVSTIGGFVRSSNGGYLQINTSLAYQDINFATIPSHNYGDAPFTLSATGPSGGSTITYTSSNTSVATISGSTVTIVGSGTATITATAIANGSYFEASPVSQTLNVNKATLTATPANASRVYGAANPTFSFNYSGFNVV